MLEEHDRVVLTDDVADPGLKAGDVGTIVHVHRDGEAFEVEFLTPDGQTAAKAVPERAAQDAVHIAIAAVHRVPFLVTWNFRHIANAAARPRIETVCRDAGIDPPLLCTPEQLVVAEDDDEA